MTVDGLTDEQWNTLKRDGALYLPSLLSDDELRQLKQAQENLRRELPYGYVYGASYSRTQPQKLESEPPLDPLQVMPIFYTGFRESFIHQLFLHPKIYDGFERVLGKDFVMTNAILHTVRPGTPRLPVHKDAHGMALAVVLLDDCIWDGGGTSFKPGTHVNSPPPDYCLDDVRTPMTGEMQTTGKAGDVYIVCVDAWHGRAANLTSQPTSKLMLHVDSRTNLHGPHWVQAYSAERISAECAKLPMFGRHILDWSPAHSVGREEAKNAMTRIEQWALANGNMCQSPIKSLVYFLMNSTKGKFSDGRGKTLPPFTSTPMLIEPFRLGRYIHAFKIKRVLRRIVATTIRALPFGGALIGAVRR